MKGIVLTIVLLVGALALLRFKPWNKSASLNPRAVVHNGPNKKADRELTVGYLPVTCHLTCPRNRFCFEDDKLQYEFQ